VEDLLEEQEPLVGSPPGQPGEERGHLRLPPGVDLGGGHAGLRRGEVVRLDVADEQAVVAQEERVVAPAGVAQRGQHVRPHRAVPLDVLGHPLRPDLELEAVAGHGGASGR
jgi:hypothetical protein